ncbi:hypothetical protein DY000_02039292 [Brassica cretica]|uniref:Uncharacterized protein n=2 Tax=Brassica cretica TaxID=69181 RepID=A0ABQ7B8D8_BRACR|nr:hypothetical protein DY000_02039292 [Brassica cretica]
MLSLLRGCMDFPGLDHSVSDKRYFIAKVHDDRSDWDLLYHLAKTHPMRLFGSHFSSPSLTLGNASEVDRVVIPEALLRHYHPLGCVRIGPHSKIWEREIPEIRRKYSTR